MTLYRVLMGLFINENEKCKKKLLYFIIIHSFRVLIICIIKFYSTYNHLHYYLYYFILIFATFFFLSFSLSCFILLYHNFNILKIIIINYNFFIFNICHIFNWFYCSTNLYELLNFQYLQLYWLCHIIHSF